MTIADRKRMTRYKVIINASGYERLLEDYRHAKPGSVSDNNVVINQFSEDAALSGICAISGNRQLLPHLRDAFATGDITIEDLGKSYAPGRRKSKTRGKKRQGGIPTPHSGKNGSETYITSPEMKKNILADLITNVLYSSEGMHTERQWLYGKTVGSLEKRTPEQIDRMFGSYFYPDGQPKAGAHAQHLF